MSGNKEEHVASSHFVSEMPSSLSPKRRISDVMVPNNENDKANSVDDSSSHNSSFSYFLRVFKYHDSRGWCMNAVALIACIASGIVLPLMDVVFGNFVNAFNDFSAGKLSSAGYRVQVNKYSLYFIYLFVAKFVATYIWTVLISITAVRATKNLRVDFVRQTLRQEVSFFDSASASLSGQITTNGNLINHGISEKLGLIFQAFATFIAAFVVAFAVQWKLTLIVIAVVPVNVIVTIICAAYDTGYEYKMFNIYGDSSSLAEEVFSNIKTAHAFWAFPKLSSRFNHFLDAAKNVGAKKSIVYALLFPLEFFCIYSAYGLAFWQGMRMYKNGEIKNPGTVVTVIFAVLVAAQALTQILPQSIAISKAAAAAQELFTIIDRESKMDSLSGQGSKIDDFRGDIQLRKVRFAYPSRREVPVLHDLDLDIPANQSTALVGASGSGKSTIFGLLERWYVPDEGSSITLDGRPIEKLNLQWLRTNIRLVQQEPTLFSGTIFQNIADGLVGTDMADMAESQKAELVEEAARAAYAHDFIQDLPKGYQTYIGERGASLSGGQKQRIVIARSIISNPKVLLLDEATSALDPKAEKIVQRALNNVAKGRTMVTVAHRLSTIRDAQNIVVMSSGSIIEQGSHAQLMQRNGAYARLIKAQDLGGAAASTPENQEASGEEDDNEKAAAAAATAAAAVEDDDTLARESLEMRSSEEMTIGKSDSPHIGLFKGSSIIVREQRKLWFGIFIALIACTLAGLTYPALAILFSKTVEAYIAIDVSRTNFFALMFFMVAIGNGVVYSVAGWNANVVAQHMMRTYRAELFENIIRQDMVFFDKLENSTGALVSRLSSEPTSLQDLLSMNVFLILINVVSIVSSSILAIVYGWKLGLVLVFGALPALVGAGFMRIRLEIKFENDTAARFAESSGLASEAVMAIRTVSSLALERAIVERFEASLKGIASKAIRSVGWKMLFYALSQSISFLAMGLGFWYGGRLVSTGEYSNFQFFTVFVAVIFSGESTAIFFQYTTSITKARSAIDYILRIRDQVTLRNDEVGENSLSEKDSSISGAEVVCDQVRFVYPTRPKLKVLRGIDVLISSGKNVALVGASGCGKSTMIALLERFYDPVSGVLRYNGEDIKTKDRCTYRRDIALVQQEPVLFQGSIRSNIALGLADEDPSDEDIIEACQQANIWTFISSLPDGLDTACGHQGLSLSGGQRQRIAIARALLRKPKLLLLDEATSALDTESEKVVKEALDRASKGRTTVAVAHRLSTVRDADLICVFEKGVIREMGKHDELVAMEGLYYDMVLGQSLDREVT